jgi:predicted ATPase
MHLLSLVRKEFLRPDRALFSTDDGFRFSHVLIRDAAYNSMAKQLRAELHERYARWLEQQLGERVDDYLEIVGFHLEQAWRYRIELGAARDGGRALAREAGERLWAAARSASCGWSSVVSEPLRPGGGAPSRRADWGAAAGVRRSPESKR